MILKDLNIRKDDYLYLGLIIAISAILTSYYINFNHGLGIYCSDVYIYLLNALYFTGTNINSMQTIYLSPVICFLTSLLFRLGIDTELSILIITGFFAILGNIGLYFLLKTRFGELLSLTGVILYSTFAINLTWLANGSIDIPAVSITIWIFLFSILSIKTNPKYYQILIPLFVIGFFTRYTVILIFPVILLYYLYHNGFKLEKNDFKFIAKGIILGLIATAIILIPIMSMSNGYFGASGQITGGITGNKGSTRDLAYNTDTSYYLVNFINFISSSKVVFANRTPVLENPTINSIIILLTLATGAILFLRQLKLESNKNHLIAIIFLVISAVSFNHVSSFITIILMFIGLLLLGKDSKYQTGIAMASWILVYFIFLSYFNIKVNRYIIPAIPPLIYMIISSIELINDKININKNIIPIILITLFLIQGFTFCFAFEQTNEFSAPKEMSDYIISEISDYENHTGVYNIRPYHWYLGKNIVGIESDNLTKIKEGNITYYISDIPQNNLSNFKEIKNIDNLYLYKKRV